MHCGIVSRADGPRFWVDLGDREVPCTLRGRLKREQQRVTSLVVVGDQVQIEPLPDGTGTIEVVAPRRSWLSRPGFHGFEHVIAANIDQIVITQAARQPNFKRHMVERYLATARRGQAGALVVVNKCDLEHPATITAWVEPLQHSGVPVLLTSTVTGAGLDQLQALLLGRLSVLAGPSGVGKSSLLNAMFPGLNITTRTGGGSNHKGRHTTTASRLYPLPGGGYLADTPGIRDLGLIDPEESVGEVFPEIEAAAAACKFRNCSHVHEPRCAVKAAVAGGRIHPDRYRHYLRLQQGQ